MVKSLNTFELCKYKYKYKSEHLSLFSINYMLSKILEILLDKQ